jgi:hypothetical protein
MRSEEDLEEADSTVGANVGGRESSGRVAEYLKTRLGAF